jgi:hypothetical protein
MVSEDGDIVHVPTVDRGVENLRNDGIYRFQQLSPDPNQLATHPADNVNGGV